MGEGSVAGISGVSGRGEGQGVGPECPPVPHCPARDRPLFSWPSTEGPHGGGLAGSTEAGAWGQAQEGSLLTGTRCWEGSEARKTPKAHSRADRG